MDNIWDDLWKKSEPETKKPSSYNSMQLAVYFQERFIAAPWQNGFGLINVRALAGSLAKWKSHAEHATVLAMIDRYMDDPEVRGKNPGWQDFLYHAEAISAKLKPEVKKDKWDLLEERWNLEHPDA